MELVTKKDALREDAKMKIIKASLHAAFLAAVKKHDFVDHLNSFFFENCF